MLGQPFIWMKLYSYDLRLEWLRPVFYLSGLAAITAVKATGFSVGFYRNALIIAYILLTMAAVTLYGTRYTFSKAVCLGFLTVFLNSYYWELVLHLGEYLTVGFYVEQLAQLWRLTPLAFFLRRYRFHYTKPLWGGLVISAGAIYIKNLFVLDDPQWWTVMMVNRAVCLLLLTYTVLRAEPRPGL